jgi:hypothetical protein
MVNKLNRYVSSERQPLILAAPPARLQLEYNTIV